MEITGLLLGLYEDNGQPMLFTLEGQVFLPLFSTIEKFEAAKKTACANINRSVKVKVITDAAEFFDSVQGVRLMLDPWATDRGTTRWTEIKRD